MFQVWITDCEEQTQDMFEYSHLLDAFKVIKETNIGPCNSYVPMLSHEGFESQLINLLAGGPIYAGRKTSEFPEGKFMILLLKKDSEDSARTPFFDILKFIPAQVTKEEVSG